MRALVRMAAVAQVLILALLVTTPSAAAVEDPCEGWTQRSIASGLGVLENVEPDGRGGLLISSSDRNAVERVTPDGVVTTFADDVDRPGGLRVRGDRLFVNTGNGLQAGLFGTEDGTLTRIHLDSGERVVIADGLVMPNGLVFDPDGAAYVSRDFGMGGAVTRIPGADPPGGPGPPDEPAGAPERWAELEDTNGLVVSGDGRHLYAVETFTLESNVYRIDRADPTDIEVVASLYLTGGSPVPKGLDDLDIDADDVLYITANSGGEVIRLDPGTGEACVIASGLLFPSAVKFGRGPGWPADHLYVVGFGGDVVELAPPAGTATGPPPATAPPAAQPDTQPGQPPAPSPAPALPATGTGSPLLALLVLAAGVAATGRWTGARRTPRSPPDRTPSRSRWT